MGILPDEEASSMRRYTAAIGTILSLILLGCVTVNIIPQVQPVQEKVIEGEGRDKVLLVDISGFISNNEVSGGLGPGKPSMVARVKEELRKAAKDSDLKGVVLRIDSPGGTVTASDLIHHEIMEFKKEKEVPVYASIMSLGTSGGYYIASAADKIYAHPTAVTGSIGVITVKFNIEGLMQKVGVQEYTIKSGELKDFFSIFKPATEEELRVMQGIIDNMYGRFLTVVEEGRSGSLSREQITALADGRPYTAEQALDAKLIDGIKYLDGTIEAMKDANGMEEARVVVYRRPGAYKDNIYSALGPQSAGSVNIRIDADTLMRARGVEFMYLWSP
jgi:protease-4